MKQMNYFAVIPGAVIGAIPPVAGWVSSGGSFTDPRLWVIAFFFFIWQIPHFWLLLLLYRNDYERAGFPTLFQKFALPQVKRLTFLYIALTGIAGLLFPIFSLLSFKLLNLAILFSSLIFLLYKSIGLLQRQTHAQTIRFMFKGINFYVLVVVIIVSIDKIKLIFIYR
jgi:protoheme IX farnesyltransferase